MCRYLNVNIDFVEYYGIISVFSNNWKQIIMGATMKYDRIYNAIAEKENAENTHCKYLQQIIYSDNSNSAYLVSLKN